jgi:hypothetical protein
MIPFKTFILRFGKKFAFNKNTKILIINKN